MMYPVTTRRNGLEVLDALMVLSAMPVLAQRPDSPFRIGVLNAQPPQPTESYDAFLRSLSSASGNELKGFSLVEPVSGKAAAIKRENHVCFQLQELLLRADEVIQ